VDFLISGAERSRVVGERTVFEQSKDFLLQVSSLSLLISLWQMLEWHTEASQFQA
jgi:hypothetical protein